MLVMQGLLTAVRKNRDSLRVDFTDVKLQLSRYKTATEILLRQLSTLADESLTLVDRLALLKLIEDTHKAIEAKPGNVV